MPAHARGEGREVRERERQKRQKSLQINGIVLAAPGGGGGGGGGDGVGAGPFPGGARRWEVARTKRNTTPKWAPDAPSPPPHPPPDTRERHGPPPHSHNPRRHSPPSPWADIPALEPPWARRPSLPEKSHKEMPPKRLSSPPYTRDSPHPGKKWLQGASLGREWYPRAPRRKDNSEMLSLVPSAGGQTPHRRDGGGPETSLPGSFGDSFSLERELAQD